MYPSVSIIILTRNRAPLLSLCLESLVNQVTFRDEIIILDNNSTDNTRFVINKFKSMLPIHYKQSLLDGYPKLYNFAMSQCKKNIIVFLDDDCVAGADFIRFIRRAHNQGKERIVQGMTYSIPEGNIYVDIMGDHYKNWLTMITKTGNSLKTFDNKNASIPRSIVLRYGGFLEDLRFGSEDIEFGIRMHNRGIPILFDKKIVAFHHERSNFIEFFKQHLRIARSEGVLDKRLASSERIGVAMGTKWLLHLKSAIVRELYYIKHLRLKDALLLPLLYMFMVGVRLYGYLRT